jgi:hypothetical protein
MTAPKVKTTLRLPADVLARARLRALAAGVSLNDYIGRLVAVDDVTEQAEHSPEDLAAAILRRAGIDPASPAHQATAARARAAVQRGGAGDAQGAA